MASIPSFTFPSFLPPPSHHTDCKSTYIELYLNNNIITLVIRKETATQV